MKGIDMENLSTVMFVLVPLLISFILFAATATGWAYNRKIAYAVAVLFLMIGVGLGIAIFLKTEILIVFIICIPFGGFITVMGLGMIADVFLYRKKSEGQFIGSKYANTGRGDTEYHSLIFTYRVDGKTIQCLSDDSYKPDRIKKRYERQETYPIWLNPKKPQNFRVKRFHGLGAGIIAFLLGFAFLCVPFDLLLSRM
jgi:hypothetical protein